MNAPLPIIPIFYQNLISQNLYSLIFFKVIPPTLYYFLLFILIPFIPTKRNIRLCSLGVNGMKWILYSNMVLIKKYIYDFHYFNHSNPTILTIIFTYMFWKNAYSISPSCFSTILLTRNLTTFRFCHYYHIHLIRTFFFLLKTFI